MAMNKTFWERNGGVVVYTAFAYCQNQSKIEYAYIGGERIYRAKYYQGNNVKLYLSMEGDRHVKVKSSFPIHVVKE